MMTIVDKLEVYLYSIIFSLKNYLKKDWNSLVIIIKPKQVIWQKWKRYIMMFCFLIMRWTCFNTEIIDKGSWNQFPFNVKRDCTSYLLTFGKCVWAAPGAPLCHFWAEPLQHCTNDQFALAHSDSSHCTLRYTKYLTGQKCGQSIY